MSERIVESYEPLAYYVNSVSDLTQEVVLAFKHKNLEQQKQLLKQGDKNHYDVFICVNHSWHGYVLVVPVGADLAANILFEGLMADDPYKIPGKLICRKFELRFENVEQRMYKISKSVKLFDDIQKYTKKFYYVGRYADVPLAGLEFAALRAAPHRYETLLNDCVEFAKEYCDALLSYCSNGLKIEKEVKSNIKKATASGFTVEKLSRQSGLSGWMGNISFGGLDVTSLMGGRHSALFLCIVVLVVFLWPVIVVVLAKRYYF